MVELVGTGLDFTLRDGKLYVVCPDDGLLADPLPFVEKRLEVELRAQGQFYFLFSRGFARDIVGWIAEHLREGRI
jgi:hypothetical protein